MCAIKKKKFATFSKPDTTEEREGAMKSCAVFPVSEEKWRYRSLCMPHMQLAKVSLFINQKRAWDAWVVGQACN